MLPLLMSATVPYYGTLIRGDAQTENQPALSDACLEWPAHGLNLFIELIKHYHNQASSLVALPEQHPVKRGIRRASYRYSTPCVLHRENASLVDWLRLWRNMGVLERFLATAKATSLPMLPIFSHCEILQSQSLSFQPGLDILAHPASQGMCPIDAQVQLAVRVPSVGGSSRSIHVGYTYTGRSGVRYFRHNQSSSMYVAVTTYALVRGLGDAIHPLSDWETVKRHNEQMVLLHYDAGKISLREKNPTLVHLSDLMPDTSFALSPSGATLHSTISTHDLEVTAVMQKARSALGLDQVKPHTEIDVTDSGKGRFFRSAKYACPTPLHQGDSRNIEVTMDASVLTIEPAAGLDYHIPLNALLLEIVHSLSVEGVMMEPVSPLQLKADRRSLRIFKRLIATLGNANVQPWEVALFIKGLLLDVLSNATSHFGYRYQLILGGASYYNIAVMPIWLNAVSTLPRSDRSIPTVAIHPSLVAFIKHSPDATRLIARSAGLEANALQSFMTLAVRALREASLASESRSEEPETEQRAENFAVRKNCTHK